MFLREIGQITNFKARGSQIQIEMVFTPVAPEIKEKVISAYLSGLGRNQIDRELRKEGVAVSHGSISNIITRYKRERSLQKTYSINVADDNYIVGPSSYRNGVELASEIKDINIDNNSDQQEIDFDDEPFEAAAENLLAEDYNEILDGESGERLLNFTVEPEQGVDIPDARDTNYVIKEANTFEESTTEENQPQSRLYRSKNSVLIKEKSRDTSLDLDCDTTNYQANFTAWVFEQKRRRGVEQRSLDLYRKRITEDRSRLESEKSNFEAQKRGLEAQIAQVNEVMPIAAQLKAMGFDFTLANSWLNCVAEMAQRKGLDLRSAAWRLADDLKNWQELGGFEQSIQTAKNQLTLLNIALEDQKAAIATLVNLQKMGMSEIEISRLVKLVNGWGKGNGNFANGLELDSRLNLQNTPQ
jgi:hypothetical protein